MSLGKLDLSLIGIIGKLEELIIQVRDLRVAIGVLQEVIVKLDRQNQRLQMIGLILAGIGTIDVVLRVLSLARLI